jgi:hypothetical protein
VEDAAGILSPVGGKPLEALVQDISEFGCQLAIPAILPEDSDVEVNLTVSEVPVTVRGKIRHAAQNMVSGVEFHGVRRGDRPLLRSLLRQLRREAGEPGGWNFEIVEVSG